VSATLFHREAEVVVDSIRATGLRFQFKAEKSLEKAPNTLDLSITNLATGTRAGMRTKGAPVILLAGYRGRVEQVFSGDARSIDHVKSGAEWVTRVKCGDGEKQYRFARVAESFAPGTTAAAVVRQLARKLGIDTTGLDDSISGLATKVYQHGYSAWGRASDELDKVLAAHGLTWSVQDGRIQVLADGSASKGRAIVLSSDTGLVGSPEHGTPQKKGKPSILKARSLLQPSIRPGSVVELRARSVKGQFRCVKVTHTGDTHGNEWFSDLEMHQI
jgi:hypothetical protein